MSEYVTPETDPVLPALVLMRTPFCDLVMVDDLKVTVSTVLSSRPPTEPIERPWPPEQYPPENLLRPCG